MRSEPTNTDLLQQMGYESRDVNVRQVLIGIVALLIFFVACMGVIAFFYNLFIPDWAKLGSPVPIPANRRLPPHPQIQTNPRRDFELYRQAEDKTLAGQGAAMPVDQALDVMATQKGVAGLRGDAVRERGNGYPGQTSAMGAAPGAENGMVSGAATPAEAGHGVTEQGGNR